MTLLLRTKWLTLLLLLGGNLADASPETGGSASAFTVVTPCPFDAAAGLPPECLSCGWLAVPENRERPGSSTLRLPVAIVRSAHERPRPDPLVFVAGGPGASPTTSLHTFQLFAAHAFGAHRDIVIYTQRGALTTEPDLRCAALHQPRGAIYLQDQSLEQRDRAVAEAAVACLRELQLQGRDLDGYSALESALDLRDLRGALGRVLAALEAQPPTVTLAGPQVAEALSMTVNWHDFLGLLHWMLYTAESLTLAPLLIDETGGGRIDLLTVLLNRVFPGPTLSGDGDATPVASDIPTLLLSGRFDPMTPDLYAEQVARRLSNATIVRIPNFGHFTLSGYTACQTELAAAFLDDLADKSGFPCLADIGPPAFVLSMEEAKARFAEAR